MWLLHFAFDVHKVVHDRLRVESAENDDDKVTNVTVTVVIFLGW